MTGEQYNGNGLMVSNIQRFATHDGPGIRTVIFLKGCGLHCPWCANPETWSKKKQLFHDAAKCVGCGRCQAACPRQAISIRDGKAHIDRQRCDSCGKCVKACLKDALEVAGHRMSLEEILAEVAKDDEYYQTSGGGVTVSGGELFCQEALPLLQALKEKGYHVTIETEGQYELKKLQEALPYIDLVFHDVKHCDPEKLKKVTGADFGEIESHLRFLQASGKETIIRVPVIPGFNRDQLDEIIAYVKGLGFERIQLLPFHPMGKGKWAKLGLRYPYAQEPMMDKASLSAYADDMVKIGG